MGWFKKKSDPITERSRALEAEIKALESQINKLSAHTEQAPPKPHVRSTALPNGQVKAAPAEPVFEEIDRNRIKSPAETETTPEHYNDLGVRKYDLLALFRRFKNHFSGPPANNPRLITYLAAGSIQGLRPLRYEKRVARNRVVAGFVLLIVLLWGIWAYLIRKH